MLNSFAPPFRLIGGYFVSSFLFLVFSIFALKFADFEAVLSLNTAGFIHLFLAGFVMSAIIASLYQLTSVILEKPFFSIKFAYLNLIIYFASLVIFALFMILQNPNFMLFSGGFLAFSFSYFLICYLMSFYKCGKPSFAKISLFTAGILLLTGVWFGFLLALIFVGFELDFKQILKLHLIFVFGGVYFIILGASRVLLVMFSLAHKAKFRLYNLAFALYLFAIIFVFSQNLWLYFVVLSLLCFVGQVVEIFYARSRKTFDYWSLNVIFAIVSLIFVAIFGYFDEIKITILLLFFGFLLPFIAGHLYKILPFLVWYHYVSPFVGKTKVPLLENMVNKQLAYFALLSNLLAVIFVKFEMIFAIFLALSVICLVINMFLILKFMKFGESYERENLQ